MLDARTQTRRWFVAWLRSPGVAALALIGALSLAVPVHASYAEAGHAGLASGEWVWTIRAEGSADGACSGTCLPNLCLDLTFFEFDIPSNATITGVEVQVKAGRQERSNLSAQLLRGGVPVGVTRLWMPLRSPDPCRDSAVTTLGGAGELWGASWTPVDINASRFGVQICSGSGNDERSLDAVRIVIHYTLPPGSVLVRKVVVGEAPASDWPFTGDLGSFTLPAAGGERLFTGLASGAYTLAETVHPNYMVSVSINGGPAVPTNAASVTVVSDQVTTVTFTNTHQPPAPGTGSVLVRKVVVGEAPASDWPFTGDLGSFTLLAGGGERIFTGLAPGTYTLAEAVTPDYTVTVSVNDGDPVPANSISVAVEADLVTTVTFTNTHQPPPPNPGSLLVRKVVVGEAPASDWPFTGDLRPFTLPAGGGERLFTDLDPGTYALAETVHPNYMVSVSINGGPAVLTNSTSVTVVSDQVTTVTFTNTHQPPAPGTGSVLVRKVVVGETPDSDWPFTGDLGSFTLLAGGGERLFTGLGPGSYTVAETVHPDYTVSISINGGPSVPTNSTSVTVVSEQVTTVTFTNTHQPPPPTTGSLLVRKVVVGEAPASDWPFTGDLRPFTLPAAGGERLFTDLDPGSYTLAETAHPDYTVTVSINGGPAVPTNAASVTVEADQTTTVTFTNTYDPPFQADLPVFPPRVDPTSPRNRPWDVALTTVRVTDFQVYDGTQATMQFLDGQYRPVTEIPVSGSLYLEVTDLDQNENPYLRELIFGGWNRDADPTDDVNRAHAADPSAGEDSAPIWWRGAGDSDVMTPGSGTLNVFLGLLGGPDTSISGIPETVKIFMWNAQRGSWERMDLRETAVGSGVFRSTTCVLVSDSRFPGRGNLGSRPGDTIIAFYQDPSNHSDIAIVSIKVAEGGAGGVQPPTAGLAVSFDRAEYASGDEVLITVSDELYATGDLIAGPTPVLTLASEDGAVIAAWQEIRAIPSQPGRFQVQTRLPAVLSPGSITAQYIDPLLPDRKAQAVATVRGPTLTNVTGITVTPEVFSSTTTFRILAEPAGAVASRLKIHIYDLTGIRVATLDGEHIASLDWNGGSLRNGAYIYVASVHGPAAQMWTFRGFVYILR